ncbi:DUF397 domain-containing protein [Streptomyces sp. XC 2026]|uniref:DUF397 domain-containing protein n=1 Tax=Streptomyces sp. XC 2026 TaxID=2782004 RepID=UPI00190560D7|nr:DUF397 domain-containing protein [Streptomyces sp. XC 2026]QQN78717.1 DUF397 domain-containing protein [Streptomyces sp. XC 2026]
MSRTSPSGWQKSSHSSDTDNCLELRRQQSVPALQLRESDDPRTVLAGTAASPGALLAALKRGVPL